MPLYNIKGGNAHVSWRRGANRLHAAFLVLEFYACGGEEGRREERGEERRGEEIKRKDVKEKEKEKD